jgi:hypothetical protein
VAVVALRQVPPHRRGRHGRCARRLPPAGGATPTSDVVSARRLRVSPRCRTGRQHPARDAGGAMLEDAGPPDARVDRQLRRMSVCARGDRRLHAHRGTSAAFRHLGLADGRC